MRSYQGLLGNEKDYLSTGVSYKLNLKGESITLQTACSTSLVAVHMACQSLLTGQSDIAIAGGVSVQAEQKTGYIYQEEGIFSPDGHCRAFDEKAQGTIFGNGLGAVVLKPLPLAIEDRDRIYAVIKGSAVNNDGSNKVGFTAPSVEGQCSAIVMAMDFAGITADTIGYVETHGTGTSLGDPIEIEALSQAYRRHTNKNQFCAIGSVKTNIGHLNTAAGIVGLIKTALILNNEKIPPSLNFQKPNPQIKFSNSPFYVITQLIDWKRGERPRRAGVSSFGISGTNAHVVLEEAPIISVPNNEIELSKHILALSAKTDTALQEVVQKYTSHIQQNPQINLSDLCFTANTGRVHFNHRIAFVAGTKDELFDLLQQHNKLQELKRNSDISSANEKLVSKIAFLFTGQGSQYIDMGKILYSTQPLFRELLNQCQTILSSYLQIPLLDILFSSEMGKSRIQETQFTQPALFSLEYALAQLWISWGIKPAAVLGHSIGEYVAACIAGAISLEDGLN